jgi:hypothetical protein
LSPQQWLPTILSPAFDAYSNRLIELRVPVEKRIIVAEADADVFACNSVNLGSIIIMNRASTNLTQQLNELGFEVWETPLTEFLKAGGAAKCLTLRVTEPVPTGRELGLQSMIENRTVLLEGHLLDSGLINRALDLIVEGGELSSIKL